MDSGTIVVMASPSREDINDEVMTGKDPPEHLEETAPTYTHKRKRTGQNEAPANGPLRNRRKVDDTREASTTEEAATTVQAHQPASDALTPILRDMDKRHNTRRSVLTKIAHALDSIIEEYCDEDKELAAEITKGFTAFLQAKTGVTISPHPNERLLQESGPTRAEPSGAPTRSWAYVSRAGQKPPLQDGTHKRAQQTNQREDLRVLVRIPEEHRGWAHAQYNFALRQAVCKTMDLSLVDVPDVYHTATGVAVRPRNKETRELLLQRKEELARSLRADAVEVPITWVNYVVPGCPTHLSNVFGETFETTPLLREEVVAQTGIEPVSVRWSRQEPVPGANKRSCIVSFLQKVRPFRLFAASGPARMIEKRTPPSRHNPGCQGYHPSRVCTRTDRCENCSARLPAGHSHPQPCQDRPRCANCYGPAPANHENCPAKPVAKNGKLVRPTRNELAKVRQTGSLLYKAAQPRETRQGGNAQEETGPDTDRNTADVIMEDPTHTPLEFFGRRPQPAQDDKPKRSLRNVPRVDYSVLDRMGNGDDE